jgi:hypothetical protein
MAMNFAPSHRCGFAHEVIMVTVEGKCLFISSKAGALSGLDNPDQMSSVSMNNNLLAQYTGVPKIRSTRVFPRSQVVFP